MQTILPPSGNTIKILGKARSAEQDLRWMHYVLAQPVDGGVLVFHTLTRARTAGDERPEICRPGAVYPPHDAQKAQAHYQLRHFYHNGLQRPVLLLL